MRKRVILITGASGEIGHALLHSLSQQKNNQIVTLDLQPLPADLASLSSHVEGDILDQNLLARLVSEYEIDTIYHLAALLSTRSELRRRWPTG